MSARIVPMHRDHTVDELQALTPLQIETALSIARARRARAQYREAMSVPGRAPAAVIPLFPASVPMDASADSEAAR